MRLEKEHFDADPEVDKREGFFLFSLRVKIFSQIGLQLFILI